MEEQTSTSSIVHSSKQLSSSHLGDVAVPGQVHFSTVVPIREECRCRRWWLFHHDIRAFTTSWLFLPVFMIYRVLVFLYTLVWLILHIYARHEEFGPHWLIFITNLGYTLLTFTLGFLALLCLVYGILYYTKRSKLLRFYPKKDFPLARVYKQDNIPWYVKIVWVMYSMSCTTAVLVFIGYYLFVYEPCGNDSSDADGNVMGSGMNASSGMESGEGMATTAAASCSSIDVETIQVHGINVVIVLLDLIVSRIPFQFLHLIYGTLFGFFYIIFSLIYFGAGGTNHRGDPFIYSVLDYRNSTGTAIGLAFLLSLVGIPLQICFFLLGWLRDAVYARIGCCFRDIRHAPFRESLGEEQANENGTAGEELSQV